MLLWHYSTAEKLMKLSYVWIAASILGIIAIIVPAAMMGTNIFFDLNLFAFVIGIGTFYAFGSGGEKLKLIENFGKGASHSGSLGFFIVLASIPALEGQEATEAIQYAVFSISLGTIIRLITEMIFNRFSDGRSLAAISEKTK
jgi:hypothetical protein